MQGLLTHAATADCFVTRPHPTRECGIVSAWWQAQVEGDAALQRQREEARWREERGPSPDRSN